MHQRYLRPLTGFSLTSVLVALLMCLVISALPCLAHKFGEFPGVGSKNQWIQSGLQFNKGVKFYQAGKLDEAISAYKLAIGVYPLDATYFFNLGIAYEERGKSGDLSRAVASYEQAAKLAPENWECWNGLAVTLYKQHRYADSKKALLLVLKNNPPTEVRSDTRDSIKQVEEKLRSSSTH